MKHYLKIILLAMLSWIVIPLRAVASMPTISLSTLIYSLLCFVLTVYLLKQYGKRLKAWLIVLVFAFFVVLPDIMLLTMSGARIIISSLPDSLLRIVAILIGWWYYKLAKVGKIVLVISFFLFSAWISSYGFAIWQNSAWVKSFDVEKEFSMVDALSHSNGIEGDKSFAEKCNGKATILYFWKMNDEKSMKQLPILQKIYDKYKGREDVAVLSIVCYDSISGDVSPERLDFLQKHNYTFPCLMLNQSKSELELNFIPKLILVNKHGKTVLRSSGTVIGGATGLTEIGELDKLIDILNN